MLKEFKEFAVKGNVIDMAVGVIIGGAFGKIVSSIVNDIIMPPFGLAIGNVDFSDIVITLKEAAPPAKAVTINIGLFINNVINFTIIAFSIFLVVRAINKFKTAKPAELPAAPQNKTCPQCGMSIPIVAKRCAYCTSTI